MRVVQAPFPGWGIDCVTVLDASRCQGLKALGASFVIRYLGSVTPDELSTILASGLLCSLVTYADQWSPASTVSELTMLAIPAGVTIWIDVESVQEPTATVTSAINVWSDAVVAAGYQAGMYVGANQPLTASELYALPKVTRYFQSMSDVPTPACGFCLLQRGPSITLAGTKVDVDYVGPDWQGRFAMMVGA